MSLSKLLKLPTCYPRHTIATIFRLNSRVFSLLQLVASGNRTLVIASLTFLLLETGSANGQAVFELRSGKVVLAGNETEVLRSLAQAVIPLREHVSSNDSVKAFLKEQNEGLAAASEYARQFEPELWIETRKELQLDAERELAEFVSGTAPGLFETWFKASFAKHGVLAMRDRGFAAALFGKDESELVVMVVAKEYKHWKKQALAEIVTTQNEQVIPLFDSDELVRLRGMLGSPSRD